MIARYRLHGEYAAVLNLPESGDWTITVTRSCNDSAITLPALKVIAPGNSPPLGFSAATRGLRLFTTKCCVGCHRHIEVINLSRHPSSARRGMRLAYGSSGSILTIEAPRLFPTQNVGGLVEL